MWVQPWNPPRDRLVKRRVMPFAHELERAVPRQMDRIARDETATPHVAFGLAVLAGAGEGECVAKSGLSISQDASPMRLNQRPPC